METFAFIIVLVLTVLPFVIGVQASAIIFRIPLVRKIMSGCERVGSEEVTIGQLGKYSEAVLLLDLKGPHSDVKNSIIALKCSVKDIADSNGVGRKLVVASHIAKMWRSFAESIEDTWWDSLMIALAIVLVYIFNAHHDTVTPGGVSSMLMAMVSSVGAAIKGLFLPFAELMLLLFWVKGFVMLKKHSRFYSEELKLE